MKILKTFLLVIYAAIVNAAIEKDETLTFNINVAKYEDSAGIDVPVTDGSSVKLIFKNAETANNVQVSFSEASTTETVDLEKIKEFSFVGPKSLLASASLTFAEGEVVSSNIIEPITGKTIDFTASDTSGGMSIYKSFYMMLGTDKVEMILSSTGVEFKKSGDQSIIKTPVFSTLKLYNTDDDLVAGEQKEISLTDIVMKRTLTTDQDATASYTVPTADAYKMEVSVTEYYDDDDKEQTPTELDGDKQDVKFIFPEEKKDGLQDGGIEISFKHDGSNDKVIDLYKSKPKMKIKLLNNDKEVSLKSANLTLGNYMLKLHAQKDDKIGMEFMISTGIYMRADKKDDFLVEISSEVTVKDSTTPIQAWKQPATPATGSTYKNTMTFNEEISLKKRSVTLAKTINTITEACTVTGSGSDSINGTSDNSTDTKDDGKCKNGVSQFVLAPIIFVASFFVL